MDTKQKQLNRHRRHRRIRAKISGTPKRPRIAVFKSNQHLYAQAIDDTTNKTLVGISDQKIKVAKGAKTEKAFAVGQGIAQALTKLGVSEAVFDTGGFKYHGRVKAVAEGMRQTGIKI